MRVRLQPPGSSGVGQPKGEFVDVEFIRERMSSLGLTRKEMLWQGRGRIAARTLQRVINSPATRLSSSSAEALAVILGCGIRDVFLREPHLAERIGRFGFSPAAAAAAAGSWVVRREERTLLAALAARRPAVIFGAPRSGKTGLVRRVADARAQAYARGVLWVTGRGDPALARRLMSECLGLFLPGPDPRRQDDGMHEAFARALWARRRLVVVDDVEHAGFLRELLGAYRGAMDLVVTTREERVALELGRDVGGRVMTLSPLTDVQVLAFVERNHRGDPRLDGRRGNHGEESGVRHLLAAIAGRPAAMQFASDLLHTTTFRSLDDIADAVAASQEVGGPDLRHLSADARALLGCLGLFGTESVPLEWASASASVEPSQVRRLCDEITAAVGRASGASIDHLSIASHLQPAAARMLNAEERRAAEERVRSKAILVARDLAALPPSAAVASLHAQDGAFLAALRLLARRGGDDPRLIEALVLVAHLLPAWRRDGIDELLREAIAAADRLGLRRDGLKLRFGLGQWFVSARSDFVSAEVLFSEAAAGYASEAAWEDAAEASANAGRSRFATLRTAGGVEMVRAAAQYARKAPDAPECLARQLANQAFAESRVVDVGREKEGWVRAGELLEEARSVVANRRTDAALEISRVLDCNHAVVGFVLKSRGWRAALRRALSVALAGPTASHLAPYHLATAAAAALRFGTCGADEALRQVWAGQLRSGGAEAAAAIWRMGELAFYLNSLDARDGAVRHGKGGVFATHGVGCGGLIAAMFVAEPIRDIFDARFIEAAKAFLWRHGGPNTGRLYEEMGALEARVKACARSARQRSVRG